MIPEVDAPDADWDCFLTKRVVKWRRLANSGQQPESFLGFLGMTEMEYARWVEVGAVEDRVRAAWVDSKGKGV